MVDWAFEVEVVCILEEEGTFKVKLDWTLEVDVDWALVIEISCLEVELLRALEAEVDGLFGIEAARVMEVDWALVMEIIWALEVELVRAFEGLDKAGALVRSGLFGFGRDGDITAAYEARGLEQEQEDEQVEPGEEGGL